MFQSVLFVWFIQFCLTDGYTIAECGSSNNLEVDESRTASVSLTCTGIGQDDDFVWDIAYSNGSRFQFAICSTLQSCHSHITDFYFAYTVDTSVMFVTRNVRNLLAGTVRCARLTTASPDSTVDESTAATCSVRFVYITTNTQTTTSTTTRTTTRTTTTPPTTPTTTTASTTTTTSTTPGAAATTSSTTTTTSTTPTPPTQTTLTTLAPTTPTPPPLTTTTPTPPLTTTTPTPPLTTTPISPPATSTITNPDGGDGASTSSVAGAAVGGVLGGIVVSVVAVIVFIIVRRRRSAEREENESKQTQEMTHARNHDQPPEDQPHEFELNEDVMRAGAANEGMYSDLDLSQYSSLDVGDVGQRSEYSEFSPYQNTGVNRGAKENETTSVYSSLQRDEIGLKSEYTQMSPQYQNMG